MKSFENKCGRIEWGLSPNGVDYEYRVYDEHGNPVVGRLAVREKINQINNEKIKNVRTLLIDLMMGNGPELSFELMEDVMKKLGGSLYLRDGSLRDFYDVFEEVIYCMRLVKDE